jgi:hypothetical protein
MSDRHLRRVAPGEIRVPDFLNALRIPVLAEEPEGEFWFECVYCHSPSCHIAEAKTHGWLVFYCESCKRGGGETGVNLWMEKRDVIDVLAIRQMKQRFLGYELKPSKRRKWELKAELCAELFMDYIATTRGATTSKFVRTVLAPALGITERNAWNVWKHPLTTNRVSHLLRERCQSRISTVDSFFSVKAESDCQESGFTEKDATQKNDSEKLLEGSL